MDNAEKLSITVTAAMARDIREKVEIGSYASASEVIRAALRALRREEEEHAERMASIRARITAWDDLMFGLPTVPFERSAIICYLVEEKRVLITNVFHAGRDFEALLRTEQASSDEEGG